MELEKYNHYEKDKHCPVEIFLYLGKRFYPFVHERRLPKRPPRILPNTPKNYTKNEIWCKRIRRFFLFVLYFIFVHVLLFAAAVAFAEIEDPENQHLSKLRPNKSSDVDGKLLREESLKDGNSTILIIVICINIKVIKCMGYL